MAHVDQVKRYLLSIIAGSADRLSTSGARSAASSTVLDKSDWQLAGDMVRQHRIGPMLHWRLQQGCDAQVPEDVSQCWARDYQQHSLRSLAVQRELALLQDKFDTWDVPSIFLKGAYLAFNVYPQAGLRPLRDIDVLVPEKQLRSVYLQLLAEGYQGEDADLVDFDGGSATVPGLLSPVTGLQVELHRRASMPDHAGAAQANHDEEGIWARHIHAPVGGRELRFFAPTDLLLHMIVHAVYDHRFDNGPLLFTDILFLCTREEIDWELFWKLAERGKWQNGCRLALSLTCSLFGALPGVIQQKLTPVPQARIDETLLLSLRDFSQSHAVRLVRLPVELPDHESRLIVLWRLCFPTVKNMHLMYGVRASGFHLAWLYIHRLFCRGSRWVTAVSNPKLRREARQIGRLEEWLGGAAQADG